MNQTKLSPEELEAIPEVQLMVDVVLVPVGGGAPETVKARSDLDDVLDGVRPPAEVWDDGTELEEFLQNEGSQKRWMPRALVVAGAMALVAGGLVVTVGQSSEAAERVVVTPEVPELPARAAGSPELALVEVQQQQSLTEEAGSSKRKRRSRARKPRSKEDLRRQVRELMGVTGEAAPEAAPEPEPEVVEPPAPRAIPTNTPMFLASRIYRRNKRTLLACDHLAQRRGESVANSRAEFQIQVQGYGGTSVKVTGTNVPEKRLSCYRVMARRWNLPRTEDGYRTVFKHIN